MKRLLPLIAVSGTSLFFVPSVYAQQTEPSRGVAGVFNGRTSDSLGFRLAQTNVSGSGSLTPTGIDDFVVRAGVGIGPFKLGSSPKDAEAIVGVPKKIIQRGAGVVEQAWWNEGLGEIRIVFVDGQAAQILVTSSNFATPEGMKVGDSAQAFLQTFSSNSNEFINYGEKDQQGVVQPTWYGKTTQGISARFKFIGTNARNLKIEISALIVHNSDASIFPQLGAILSGRQVVESEEERYKADENANEKEYFSVKKRHLAEQHKPTITRATPKVRLSSRQQSTARRVYKKLVVLQSRLEKTRDGGIAHRIFAQAKKETQPLINTLPKGQPGKGFELALIYCQEFAVLSGKSGENAWSYQRPDLSLTPLADTLTSSRQSLNEAREYIK